MKKSSELSVFANRGGPRWAAAEPHFATGESRPSLSSQRGDRAKIDAQPLAKHVTYGASTGADAAVKAMLPVIDRLYSDEVDRLAAETRANSRPSGLAGFAWDLEQMFFGLKPVVMHVAAAPERTMTNASGTYSRRYHLLLRDGLPEFRMDETFDKTIDGRRVVGSAARQRVDTRVTVRSLVELGFEATAVSRGLDALLKR